MSHDPPPFPVSGGPPEPTESSAGDAALPGDSPAAGAARAHPALRPLWNAGERRVRAPWRLIGQLLLFVLLFVLLSTVVFAPLRPVLSGHRGELPWLALTRAIVTLAVLGSVALAARWLDRRPLRDFGLQLGRAWWADLGFGFGLGALLMTLIHGAENAAGWITVSFALPDVAWPASVGALGTSLVLFLAVGFSEELLFRGYPLRTLADGLRWRRVGPGGALALSAVLTSGVFGLLHGGNPNATWVSTLNVSAAGLLLSLGYVLTGRLALSIGLHVTWNFFQGAVYGFPVSGFSLPGFTLLTVEQGGPELWTGGAFGPEAGLVGLLAMGLGTALILAWVRWREGRLAFCVALAEPPAPRVRGA